MVPTPLRKENRRFDGSLPRRADSTPFVIEPCVFSISINVGKHACMDNSFALPQAVATYDACRFIGYPECGVNLAQAVVYMAKSKKSITVYSGFKEAMNDVKKYGPISVPLHLRNAPTEMMKKLDYGKDYKYTPEARKEENEKQVFLPKELKNKKYIKK